MSPRAASGPHMTLARSGWARLLLAVVVVASSAFAMRHVSGHDFVHNVWAPTRGLLSGLNPYDPADVEYLRRYDLPVVAGLYTPAALALHAPLALLSRSRAAKAVAILNAAVIWLGILLLIPPRSARASIAAAVAGAVLMVSEPVRHTIYLGQLSAVAFAGLALVVSRLGRDPSATWLPAVGITLVALKPQSGVPIFVALGVLGCWRILGRAALILILLSVPGVGLLIRSAGSLPAIFHTAGSNLALFTRLPPNDLANAGNLRIDLLGTVSHLNGPVLSGFGWILLAFVIVTAVFALVLRSISELSPRVRVLGDPFGISLVALYTVTSLHHLTYEQLLLFVGPLAAFSSIVESGGASRRTRSVAVGGMALMGAGLVFREGIRRRIALWLPTLPVHTLWVVLPTVIAAAIVVVGLTVDRRARLRSEPHPWSP
jgi:hypothetical protein